MLNFWADASKGEDVIAIRRNLSISKLTAKPRNRLDDGAGAIGKNPEPSTELFPRLGIADTIRSKCMKVDGMVGPVIARGDAEITSDCGHRHRRANSP
jgi:hypothetical protein